VSYPGPPTLRGARVAVTGGAGFIGANLVRRLLDLECEVHALIRLSTQLWRIEDIRSRLALHDANVLDVEAVGKTFEVAQPQAIFHLAMNQGHPAEPEGARQMLRTSVEGTYNVLQAAGVHGARRSTLAVPRSTVRGPVPSTRRIHWSRLPSGARPRRRRPSSA
jgi:nucleoside-diphosphate-sugar epimerase